MRIATENSDQSLEEDRVIAFPRGLPGFESQQRFRLLHDAGSNEPALYWLVSLDDEDLQFSVAEPASLQVNYEIALSDEESALLQLDSETHCAVLLILSRSRDHDGIRANFLAPLLINTERRIGLQKSLNAIERSVTIRAL